MMSNAEEINKKERIVLLLDMDCFYAQCETIRLGLDRKLPLCLMQWNSALAVNYPAREYGIKRGATFEEIQKASNNKCVVIHVPVITPTDNDNTTSTITDYNDTFNPQTTIETTLTDTTMTPSSSLSIAYEQEYNLPPSEQTRLYYLEKNRIRRPSEGKASIERYRLASARIFRLIVEDLTERLGKVGFVLERASVDELYVDVTGCVYGGGGLGGYEEYGDGVGVGEDVDDSVSDGVGDCVGDGVGDSGGVGDRTVVCAQLHIKSNHNHNGDDENNSNDDHDENLEQANVHRALLRGCAIARGIRRTVFETLGFTLSAGVSTSKTVAKLAASYGKPAGQAVVFPEAIPYVMEETKIKKVRNLGGKLGQRVRNLLPPNESDTMGSVARLLNLPTLCQHLGQALGRTVYNLCRGIDDQPVKETRGALTKSITAYKSFGEKVAQEDGTVGSWVEKWTTTLVVDVVRRVRVDEERNRRFPTLCVIQYYWRQGISSETKCSSMRIPFPSNPSDLCKKVQEALASKRTTRICRLGISATGFEHRPRGGGIVSFLRKGGEGDKNENENKNVPTRFVTKAINHLSKPGATKGHDLRGRSFFDRWSTEQRASSSGTALLSSSSPASASGCLSGTKPSGPLRNNDELSSSSVVICTNDDNNKKTSIHNTAHILGSKGDNKECSSDGSMKRRSPINLPEDDFEQTDLTYAQKLQESFDREHSAYQRSVRSKRAKIDHFFGVKNKRT